MKNLTAMERDFTQRVLIQSTTIDGSGWTYEVWQNNNNDFFWRAISLRGENSKEPTDEVFFLPGTANTAAQKWVRSHKH